MPDTEIFKADNYSHDLQNLMQVTPGWPVRWGITIISAIILSILFASYYIEYPDIIKANITLSAHNPSVKLIAKSQGRIKFLVSDNSKVNASDIIAYITNTADFEAVKYYTVQRQFLAKYLSEGKYDSLTIKEGLNMGELQDIYVSFYNLITELKRYEKLNKVQTNLEILDRQKKLYSKMKTELDARQVLSQEQRMLNDKRLKRDSLLYKENVSSLQEYENSRLSAIPSDLTTHSVAQEINMMDMNIVQLENRKMDLVFSEDKYLSDLKSRILSSFNEFEKRFRLWEDAYLFIAPVSGRVTLFEVREDGQYVSPNQETIVISPEHSGVVGYAQIPIPNTGKLKVGQRIKVDLINYPANEYGFIYGQVASISSVPKDNQFFVTVTFPSLLKTDLGKIIPYQEQSVGTGSIITEDVRMIERFFKKIRDVLSR